MRLFIEYIQNDKTTMIIDYVKIQKMYVVNIQCEFITNIIKDLISN
jgi:hypothetical protein